MSSWVVFTDLIKELDSIYDELMFKLLAKFGVSDWPIQVIKKSYKKLKIELSIDKYKNVVDYTTGVKQGDTIALISLIIVMQCLAELLEKKWREKIISMPQFKQNFNMFYNKGKLISHKGKNHFLTKDELFYSYMSMTVLQFFLYEKMLF